MEELYEACEQPNGMPIPSPSVDGRVDAAEKEKKRAKKEKRKAKAARVLGIVSMSVAAARLLLCPVLSMVALLVDALSFVYIMLGGGLVLAMTTIVLPFLPLLLILLALLGIVAIFAAELLPIALGVLAFCLDRSAKKSQSPCASVLTTQPKAASTGKFATCGFVMSVAAEPFVILPTLLFSLPFVFVILISAVFFCQLMGIAVAG